MMAKPEIVKAVKPPTKREQKARMYKSIVEDLQPLVAKYGRVNLRWALNKWNYAENVKDNLLKQKAAIERQLEKL